MRSVQRHMRSSMMRSNPEESTGGIIVTNIGQRTRMATDGEIHWAYCRKVRAFTWYPPNSPECRKKSLMSSQPPGFTMLQRLFHGVSPRLFADNVKENVKGGDDVVLPINWRRCGSDVRL